MITTNVDLGRYTVKQLNNLLLQQVISITEYKAELTKREQQPVNGTITH